MTVVLRFALTCALIAFSTTEAFASSQHESSSDETMYWMKLPAKDKYERTKIEALGASIEHVSDDHVVAIASEALHAKLQKLGLVETSFVLTDKMDFPAEDTNFHNYEELKAEFESLAARFPEIARLGSIGKTLEGREILHLRISGDMAHADERAAVVFMGGHHAREHLSIELPILLAKHLLESYANGDQEIQRLINGRDIHIIPMVNPDGAEFDIASGRYRWWRKNRRENGNGTMGVDLNRNYSYKWGTGGSSTNGDSETFRGPEPFSEPETQAVRDFINNQKNLTTLLSIHTYSALILYPWGHTYDKVPNERDQRVFETMANKMAEWNGYTPQQTSDLYIASGDTTDWAYGTRGIFSFTFELDPTNDGYNGTFYPGQEMIPVVFEKNLKPALYLIDHADNPYRVIEPNASRYGLGSPLVN